MTHPLVVIAAFVAVAIVAEQLGWHAARLAYRPKPEEVLVEVPNGEIWVSDSATAQRMWDRLQAGQAPSLGRPTSPRPAATTAAATDA